MSDDANLPDAGSTAQEPTVSAIFDAAAWRTVEGFDFTDITYHRARDAGVVRIAFDRPEVRNAFRPGTVDELFTALDHEIRRAERYGSQISLLFLDVDHFKKVNDTHGHHAGDVVIKKMAEIVKENTRGSDLVARFGGDEFIVLITSTTEEQAVSYAEKLREMVSAADIAIPGTEVPVRITVSGGLAMFPTHGQSTAELFRAADDALYESKQEGRNRITIAASVGLDSGIAKGTDAVRETPVTKDISVDTGSDVDEYPLGKPSGDLIAAPAPRKIQEG